MSSLPTRGQDYVEIKFYYTATDKLSGLTFPIREKKSLDCPPLQYFHNDLSEFGN